MANKVKNCYGCPADTYGMCLLGYKREFEYGYVDTPFGTHTCKISYPIECCHKPKTVKEFKKRLKDK